MTQIEQEILSFFDKSDKDFATPIQIRDKLSQKFLKQIGITKKSTSSVVKNKLLNHLTDKIRITNGYKSNLYVAKNISDENLIINAIKKKTQSSMQLRTNFPISNKRLVILLSQLISNGKLSIQIDDYHKIKLSVNPKTVSQQSHEPEPVENLLDDKKMMKKAYDAVSKGRNYIRIHEIRDYLKWSRERFDFTLESLARDYAIQLHYGDPSALTEDELKKSYMDDDGGICITVTWREEE